MVVTFYGVRGSTPCQGPEIARYGGNTSCVAVEVPGNDPVLFDLGTGLRYFGLTVGDLEPLRASCLLSHLHWDHVQGLPFFSPVLRPGSDFHVYAPVQESGESVRDVFHDSIRPPLFPINLHEIPGTITFHDTAPSNFDIGSGDAPIEVMARRIPHVGVTLGYRLSWGGVSVAYLCDHQQPIDGSMSVTDDVLELCDGVDLLIHDSQYLPHEFEMKATWGHCTPDYAVWVADQAAAKTLALFHHDPSHNDDCVDRILDAARLQAKRTEVIAAAERTSLTVRTDGIRNG